MPKKQHRSEVQVQKSPAEFFAEHQSIAGFDNLGKSLYTSLRELVENSLDACESIQTLPDIQIRIEEFTQEEFNAKYVNSESPLKKKPKADEKTAEKKPKTPSYFALSVKDNGCGMQHKAIPELLGRVLSGSKHGVRQTRGKFGLGAKMALIWAKKSTGQPIRIKTTHTSSLKSVSTCVLDMDIYKNAPNIIEHSSAANSQGWRGTEMTAVIAGNWTTYKSRIVQYLQQLAIITPYASLSLEYFKKGVINLQIQYDRRSEQMPPAAQTTRPHPFAVNNLVLEHLLQQTRTTTLKTFLTKELSCVTSALAHNVVNDLKWEDDEHPHDLTTNQITRLVQVLQRQKFAQPDANCLSPLGEYNLNLGVSKVLEPDLVATARSKPGSFEGHAFVVEAALSLGGPKLSPGISVIRFANRIPLLFEGGADVATRVAQTKIQWSNYKIDHKRDKIGVFVSIVSTKIPFKGTSKEYIGDDATEIQVAVKKTLQSCANQLKGLLTKRHALRDAHTRKARLAKHVPDASRSLFGLLDAMRKRKLEDPKISSSKEGSSPTKRLRLDPLQAQDMIKQMEQGQVTEASFSKCLLESIDVQMNMPEENDDSQPQEVYPVYLVPLYNLEESSHDISTPLFTFRPIVPPRKIYS